MTKNFNRVLEIIGQNKNFLITTHLLPDGDAIGSVIALSAYLKSKNKNTFLINHSPTPDYLKFLDPEDEIKIFGNNPEYIKIINDVDVIFLVDTNEYGRTKTMEKYLLGSKAIKVCIDHHQELKTDRFDAFITDTDSPATSQILYDFFISDDPEIIDEKMAAGLYAGIMTDTGSFRYPRTDEKTFKICADLVARGADPVLIYDIIYSRSPKNKVLLLSKYIDSFEFHYNDKLVIGTITQKDFQNLGLDVQDVEGFSSFIMTIENVIAGITIVELKDYMKISLRSKGDLNIGEFAKVFGGGGHKNAAGANYPGNDVNALKKIINKEIGKYLETFTG